MKTSIKTIYKLSIASFLFTFPQISLANAALAILIVITPFALLSLIPISLLETTVVLQLEKKLSKNMAPRKLWLIILLANFISYIAGFILWANQTSTGWYYLLPITYTISVIIEGFILYLFIRKTTNSFIIALRESILFNLISYTCLVVLAILFKFPF